jgi:hypothetical protein
MWLMRRRSQTSWHGPRDLGLAAHHGAAQLRALGALIAAWRFIMIRPFLACLSLLLLPGCEGETPSPELVSSEPPSGESLQTDSTAHTLQSDAPGWTATIGFVYRTASDTVYVVNCNGTILMNLQKLNAEEWTDAWYAEGDQCLSPPIVIPPDTEYRGEMMIWGAEQGTASYNTFRVPDLEGVYRLVWNQPVHHYRPGAGTFGDTLELGDRVSNRFSLERQEPGP